MLKKKGFVIKVEKLFKWKNLPLAKVFFCDCQRFADLIRKNPGNTQLLAEYCNRIFLHKVNRLVAGQEVRGNIIDAEETISVRYCMVPVFCCLFHSMSKGKKGIYMWPTIV